MGLAVKHKLFDYVKRISTEMETNNQNTLSRNSILNNPTNPNTNYQQMANQFINNK